MRCSIVCTAAWTLALLMIVAAAISGPPDAASAAAGNRRKVLEAMSAAQFNGIVKELVNSAEAEAAKKHKKQNDEERRRAKRMKRLLEKKHEAERLRRVEEKQAKPEYRRYELEKMAMEERGDEKVLSYKQWKYKLRKRGCDLSRGCTPGRVRAVVRVRHVDFPPRPLPHPDTRRAATCDVRRARHCQLLRKAATIPRGADVEGSVGHPR